MSGEQSGGARVPGDSAEKLPILQAWGPVAAAAVTVLGGMWTVYMQTSKTAEESQQVLRELTVAIDNSQELRQIIAWPLEGRWDYRVEWVRYFGVESVGSDPSQQFTSAGVADIHWRDNRYMLLLGYENATAAGQKLAVSVNPGEFAASPTGLPDPGSKITMRYAHRLGRDDATLGTGTVDVSSKLENRYVYVITGYRRTPDGLVTHIDASIDVGPSAGKVTFERIY